MHNRIIVKGRRRRVRRLYREAGRIARSRRHRSTGTVRGERRHPRDIATSWPNKASSRSRRTYSGVKSRASTSASLQRPDWQYGLRLYQAYDRDEGVEDIKDTVDAVAKLPECTGKVAVLGYCLGGADDLLDSRALSTSTLQSPITAVTRRSILARSTAFMRRC